MFKKFSSVIGCLEGRLKIKLIFLTMVICASALLEVLAVYLFGTSVSVLVEGALNPLSSFGLSNKIFILFSCLLIVASGLIVSYVLYYRAKVAFAIGGSLSLKVLYNKVHSPIKGAKLSEIINDVTFETDRFAKSYISELLQFITRTFIALSLITYIIFFLEPLLFIFILTVIFVYAVLTYYLKSKISYCGKVITLENEKRYQLVKNGYLGIRDFRTLGRFDFVFNKFEDVVDSYNSSNAKVQYYALIPRYLIEAIVLSLVLLLLFFNNGNNSTSSANAEVVSSSFLAILKLLPQISQAYQSLSNLMANKASLDRIYNSVFESDTRELNHEHITKTRSKITSLGGEVLNSSYGDKLVFKDLSFKFQQGGINYISGPSGSGKSTLLDILCGLKSPDSGTVTYGFGNGTAAGSISYTSQSPFLFDGTIYENLTLGSECVTEERCWEALNLVGLDELICGTPEGLNTVLGDEGMKLSGGQTQRLSISRALCFDSDIQIYDEPTSALDKEASDLVMKSLSLISKEKLVIVVTHDVSYIGDNNRLEL